MRDTGITCMHPHRLAVASLVPMLAATVALAAPPPLTLDDVPKGLPEISADEPMAAKFSAEKAAEYLDRSALNWQKTKNCATCHTNLFYMAARPALSSVLPNSGEV